MNGSNGYAPANYGAPPPQGYPQGYSPYGAAPPSYGPPPQPGHGQVQYPQGYAQGYAQAYAQPYPQHGTVNPLVTPKNGGLAVALELLGGSFLQTFGIGHLYAGNVGMGLGLMLGYWALTAINFVLCFAFIGFITWPVTWVVFMIVSAITANNAAKKFNVEKCGQPAF
jgi:TM2 domain-containing membrane protein YozV